MEPKPSPSRWQPPVSFGEYRLVRSLGRGAMGEVFLAHDTLLDRPVAVKFIAGVAPDQAQRERFRTEARAIARVQHPNVVAIHRVGEIENRPYLVSELLQGDSLDRLPKPMPWSRVLAVGIGLARGLAAAHRRGVLHRDIKPANAMLAEDGQVKLLDFGVAKLLDAAGEPGEQEEPPPREGPAMAPPAVEDTVDLPSTTPPARRGPRPPPTGLVGTPLYMAPEVWLGEPATARSDLYSLGVLLYELCSGQVPHPAASRQELREAVLHRPFVPLAQVAPEVDPAFAAVLARCLAREPNERFASAEALREALEAIEERAREAGSPREQPYPGLHPFTAGDRATFFGRAAQVRAVVDRLRAEPLVVVAGDSGAGKSSLCRAGVLPRLAEGALGPGAVWVCRELLPGREPLRALAEALAPALGCAGVALLEELRQAPTELGRRVRALGGGRRMLVFVDQLEELLTLSTMAEVEHFGQALAALLDEGSGRVLATARGDFLARLAALPSLGERLAGGLYLLPQLGEAGLREAVVGPARAQGFTFETEEMVGALVAAGRAEGGLPLLQFALAELWERRDATRRVVPAKALVALGGVEGALARHADGVLASLRPGQRAAARRLLPRLVLAEGTRARRTAAELFGERGVTEEDARGALEALVRGRLVLARESSGEAAGGTYELAHEVLLKGWDTLRGWLASGEEQRALRQRLERACADWERLGRPRALLWSAPHLAEVKRLRLEESSAEDEVFLQASRRAVWWRRLTRAAAVLSIPAALALGYAGLELRARRAVAREAREALAMVERNAATAREEEARAEALRRQAFSLFDEGRDELDVLAEKRWAGALEHGAREDRLYQEAAERLQSVLLRDGRQPEVRLRLAEVLYERLRIAERDNHPQLRAALHQELFRYDDEGRMRARLEAPARLGVESAPPGAAVRLEQAVEEEGRLRWSPPQDLGTTPLADVVLPPGSYRLSLALPDGRVVLAPVLLARDERFGVWIPFPDQVPEGFVYVPPGRFLSGSTDDEHFRRTVARAPPLHQLTTGGFFISRTEVTYRDWIAFLRARPELKAVHRPHGRTYFGNIELIEQADGSWQFVLERPGAVTYRAREGAPVRYLDRTRRAEQDWLRFPVSGVTAEGAAEYVKWLRETGRVPDARLCDAREWERAARGADGRIYPHGNRLDDDDANFDRTYGQKARAFGPDAIGSHPASDSPFGVADLAGNVWEWVQRAHLPGRVVQAGGSFYQDELTSRSFNYGDGEPNQRDPFNGFRVCASPLAP